MCRRFNHRRIAGFAAKELQADEISTSAGNKKTPSWVFQHALGGIRVFGKILVGRADLVHPPETNVSSRTRELPFLDQTSEATADLEKTGSTRTIVVGRRFFFLEVRDQDNCWLARVGPSNPTFDDSFGRLAEFGIDVDLHLDRFIGPIELFA